MDQMSDEIKRVKRELKFKGKIIDFYQDTMEINGDHTVIHWRSRREHWIQRMSLELHVLQENWKKKPVIAVRIWNG